MPGQRFGWDALSGDPRGALEDIGVPSYILDRKGVVRWLNPAAVALLGDVRGRHFTSVVAPETAPRAREEFTRKILGGATATEAEGVLWTVDRTRVALDVSAVPLRNGESIVGVFGLLVGGSEAPPPHPGLTPRQAEVLKLLEQGRSNRQIAGELHVSVETVKVHVRAILRALGVDSRLEAVAVARQSR